MNILCNLGYHRAYPSKLWNDGHYFSQCVRCGVSMIRTAQDNWRPVPPGMKVVWRAKTDDDIAWPTHML